jgi:putative inorganic carbon (hco3(-)) transporter
MPFLFHTGSDLVFERQRRRGLRLWIIEQFVRRRMNTPVGYVVLVAFALAVGGLVGAGGWQMATALAALLIFAPLLVATFLEVRLGLFLILLFCTVVPLLKRLDPILPFTLLVDATLAGMVFGVFIQQIYPRDWSFLRHPVVLPIGVWGVYCLFQLTNPSMASPLAWFYAARSAAGYWLLLPVALFAFRQERQVYRWISFVVVVAALGASYGLWQEWNGFQAFEMSWLYSRPDMFTQVSYEGSLRKFSFYSDPGTFGLAMAAGALFSLALALVRRQSAILRVVWGLLALLCLAGLLISGTRTAFMVLPLAYLAFAFLLWRKEVFLLGLALALVWGSLLSNPLQAPVLQRLQSAFNPDAAAFYPAQLDNQDFVQPYIQSHPIGNGLGSTGETGQIFAPYTLLSQFPPNSGYVQIAVETGWLGLLLYSGVVLLMLFYSVKATFRLPPHSRSRLLAAALTALALALVIAHYPQKSLLAFPTNLLFPIAIAATIQLDRINKKGWG